MSHDFEGPCLASIELFIYQNRHGRLCLRLSSGEYQDPSTVLTDAETRLFDEFIRAVAERQTHEIVTRTLREG
jgi:hypothetical protein